MPVIAEFGDEFVTDLRNSALAKSPPWRVSRRGGKWVVTVAETGEAVGTHDSREEAEAHQRALYANADGA
jgi:hypothetical protein